MRSPRRWPAAFGSEVPSCPPGACASKDMREIVTLIDRVLSARQDQQTLEET